MMNKMKNFRSLSRQNAIELEDDNTAESFYLGSHFNDSLEQLSITIAASPQHLSSYNNIFRSSSRDITDSQNAPDGRQQEATKVLQKEVFNERSDHQRLHKKSVEDESALEKSSREADRPPVQEFAGPKVLHKVCRSGDVDSVRLLLLSPSTDVNAVCVIDDVGNITPLHVAVQHRRLQVARQLLEGGCQANVHQIVLDNHGKATEGMTALHLAVMQKDELMLQLLLERDADVMAGAFVDGNHHVTCLHLAAGSNDAGVCKLLLEEGGERGGKGERDGGVREAVMKTESLSGLTALHWACMHRNHEAAEVLLQKGCNVVARCSDGSTPLHFSCLQGDHRIVATLLKHQANLSLPNQNKLLPLHLAIKSGSLPTVKLLLEAGGDVEVCSNQVSALQMAVVECELKVVELLLEKEAQVDKRTACNFTPLHEAAHKGYAGIVEVLLKKGAQVSARASRGTCSDVTSLHLACMQDHLDVANLLINFKADVNSVAKISSRSSVHCLHLASENNCKEIAKLLLSNAANVNCRDSLKDTPLHIAVQHNHLDMVKILLNSPKCKRKLKNSTNLTVFDLAKELKRQEIVTYMTNHENYLLKVNKTKVNRKCFLKYLCGF